MYVIMPSNGLKFQKAERVLCINSTGYERSIEIYALDKHDNWKGSIHHKTRGC